MAIVQSARLLASLLLLTNVLAIPAPSTQLHSKRAPLDKRIAYANHFPVIAQNATYDFIVVGGGSAGLGVASRLAESGDYTVAVVEAGGFYEIENGNTSVVPAYSLPYDAITYVKPSSSGGPISHSLLY